jgi:REP element-mobilizing transposase RayT
MAYVKNWLHCVWGTKNRYPFLKGEFKRILINHIIENSKEKDIHIDHINGHLEHIHCLILLRPDLSLADAIRLIKGESSFWINRKSLTNGRFSWAVEYYAASVSQDDLPKVRRYIRNQDVHHQRQSWQEEYEEFLRLYGFEEFKG